MKKKAQLSTTITYILIAIAAFVIFFVIYKLSDNISTSQRGIKSECYSTMILKTHTTIETTLAKYEGIPQACPKYTLTFYDDKAVILKGEKKFKTIKYESLTAEIVYYLIAEEMKYCWEQFGYGKLDAFWLPKTIWGQINFLNRNIDMTGCRICTDIKFDLKDRRVTEFKEFTDYLKKTDIQKGIPTEDTKKTYYNFIAENPDGCNNEDLITGKKDNCWEELAENPKKNKQTVKINTNITIKTTQEYHVTFIRRNIKENEGTMRVYLLPSDKIDGPQSVCNTMLPY